jgi:pimeloyl-ACP methyl ester carboxylesterase
MVMTEIRGIMKKKYYYILVITGIIVLSLRCYIDPKTSSELTTQNINAMVETLKLQAKVSGDGIPLLLVPGGLTGWKSWEPFVEIFSTKQRKVIRVQLINVEYGIENQPLPDNYSVKTESRALAATLDSLGYYIPLDIVAWSYGALVTLDYALDHPERIRTLTIIEPPAIWVLREKGALDVETQQTLNFFESLHGDITEDMLAAFLQEAGFVKPGESPRNLPQWTQWLPFRQSLRNSPAIVVQRDKLKRLQDFKQPVLLVKGTGSVPFLHHIIDGLSSNLPNSHIIELPGGHAPHIVSRDKFLLDLEKFQKESSK